MSLTECAKKKIVNDLRQYEAASVAMGNVSRNAVCRYAGLQLAAEPLISGWAASKHGPSER